MASLISLRGGFPAENCVERIAPAPDDAMRLVSSPTWLDGPPRSDPVSAASRPRPASPRTGLRSPTSPSPQTSPTWNAHSADRMRWSFVALVVPLLLGGAFAALFLRVGRGLAARPTITVLLKRASPILQFRPGGVGHHGLQVVLVVSGVGLLLGSVHPGHAPQPSWARRPPCRSAA